MLDDEHVSCRRGGDACVAPRGSGRSVGRVSAALVDGIPSTPEWKVPAMSFLQIIEYQTSNIDEVEQLGRAFRDEYARLADVAKPLRGMVTADEDRPGYYLSIIEFESAEAAAEVSRHPERQAFSARLSGLMEGPPRFYNLSVLETWEMPRTPSEGLRPSRP